MNRIVPAISLFLIVLSTMETQLPASEGWGLSSPSGRVRLEVRPATDGSGALSWRAWVDEEPLLLDGPLGISRRDQAFVEGLELVAAGPPSESDATYEVPHGKRRVRRDHHKERTLLFRNAAGAKLEIVLRAHEDGVALRYRFPEESDEPRTVIAEATGFRLPTSARVWAHPYDKATTYSPAYETYYEKAVPAGTPSPHVEGWAYPLLFRASERGAWGLVTEAALDRTYCGTRLEQGAPGGAYRVRFPDASEGNGTGAVEPSWTLPWATPWRLVIAASDVRRVVESTLVEDLSPPSRVADSAWIRPGRASWSWLYDHQSPQDYEKLRDYVDLAAEMGWEYSLVDANWTIMRKGTIHDLIDHAKAKGVGILLWYNSGGPHNHVTEKPRGEMDLPQVRRAELRLLREWGVKGIKVDFFQSDKQNVIALYQDILEDAAEQRIMVNFHGCTLPRGWSRTYPHLMSMEAMRGEECYSFDRSFPERAPGHNATLPFTRNVVGPMDYTPTMFKDNVYPLVTTAGHEIALPVIFESGWVHFADGASVYRALPAAPKDFLRRVPAAWDETLCLAGEPSDHVALARRAGREWFVAAINGKGEERPMEIDLSFLGTGTWSAIVIEDDEARGSFATRREELGGGETLRVRLRPFGGFAARFAPSE